MLVYIALVAFSMVSRVPTFSGKGVGRVSREWVLPILAAVAIIAALLVTYTWEVVTFAAFTYIAAIPVSVVSYLRQKRAWEKRVAAGEAGVENEADTIDLDGEDTMAGEDKA